MKILIILLLPTIILSNYPTYQLGTPNPNIVDNKSDVVALEKRVDDLTKEMATLKKILNQLVGKLDALQASVNKIKIAPPVAADNKKNDKPKRKSPNPDYVHNIPQGDSYFIGNPNARVTITEFFDFQ